MSELFHAVGNVPSVLRVGTPLRILDAGMRKPVLFQLDGPRGASSWVVKAPHREGKQETALLFELIGAELAAWLGLLTPAVGLTRLPSTPLATDDTDAGRAARDIYIASAGRLAFCSRFIDHAPPLRAGDLDDLRSVSAAAQDDAIRLLALDALLRHYDRTPANSNALAYDDRLIAIDHGLAFFRLGAIDETGMILEPDTFSEPAKLVRHISARLATKRLDLPIWQAVALQVHALDDAVIRAMLERIPEELDRPQGRPLGVKPQVAAFLRARRDAFDTIMETVRACLPR